MKHLGAGSFIAVCLLAAGCAMNREFASNPEGSRASYDQAPPLFDGIGGLHRRISTSNALAQRYFDQGLAFQYGFNLEGANRMFSYAAKLDPDCAMAWWGVALANGPHLNGIDIDAETAAVAWDAIQKAKAGRANDIEKALIEAESERFTSDPNAAREPLDTAYAAAMNQLAERYPDDVDIAALRAEAAMILHPWDLHEPGGKPKPWTEDIIRMLQDTLAMDSHHPLAMHLFIHAVEGSDTPELAEETADALRNLQPDLGHMVHMPSHIYVRVGRWDDAIQSNRMAIAADRAYVEKTGLDEPFLGYMAHNYMMESYAAMMSGRSEDALGTWDGAMSFIPQDELEEMAGEIDGFLGSGLETKLRFGLWDEVLDADQPHEGGPVDRTLRHFARAVAWAAKGETKQARQEQALFVQAREKIPDDHQPGYMFAKAPDLLRVAEHMMNGEILLSEGRIDDAVDALRLAALAEDELPYTEPPDWLLPTRHALGAVLIHAERFEEAEVVYREDLARSRENGWALFGLAQSLRGQGRHEEATSTESRFGVTWANADIELESSCKCVK